MSLQYFDFLPSASEDDLWPSKESVDPTNDLVSSDTRRDDGYQPSPSFKSLSSPLSRQDDQYVGNMKSTLLMFEKTDLAGWASYPSHGTPSSSTEIIEGLEREVQWLQHTLDEAEKEWDQVGKGLEDRALWGHIPTVK